MIDWFQMNRRTEMARAAVLRNMLKDDGMSDAYKLVCVGEKMENFDDENELLDRLQSLETKDDLPPCSLEERSRLNDVKRLIAKVLMKRALVYSGAEIPGDMFLPVPRQQRRMNRDR